jgi:hypothetical protein
VEKSIDCGRDGGAAADFGGSGLCLCGVRARGVDAAGDGEAVLRGGRREKTGLPVTPRGENGRVIGACSSCHVSAGMVVVVGEEDVVDMVGDVEPGVFW